jgi:hypothetical protein
LSDVERFVLTHQFYLLFSKTRRSVITLSDALNA